ncbi:SOUL family heme-binding protein [Halobacterium yunchengense]|uniref:SOUL family heme-binding protein n=1 Tax=Halobacterium yunchengense TaxID=3108497 RepID=UPI0030085539
MRTTTRLAAWTVGVGAAALAAAAAYATYASRQAERVDYERVLTLDGVELRRYPPAVLVETTAATPRGAFSRLFAYISGENEGRRDLSMTAPVRVDGATVPMTAPVRVGRGESERGESVGVTMAFYLPAEYTAETAPEPTDPDVELVAEPARTLAVRTFSWRPTEARVAAQRRRLLDALADRGVETAGEPFFLGYDAPGTLPFLRTNEVAVAVAD